MRSLFSGTRETPGVCSPSRRVVSKNLMVLGKRLNKAIPHLNHISCFTVKPRYKIYGGRFMHVYDLGWLGKGVIKKIV